MKHYSEAFKSKLIQKILLQSNRSMCSIAKEAGVIKSTFHDWVNHYRNRNNSNLPVSSKGYSPSQHLKMIDACSQLSEVEIGKYCRSRGIYQAHLEQWRKSLK